MTKIPSRLGGYGFTKEQTQLANRMGVDLLQSGSKGIDLQKSKDAKLKVTKGGKQPPLIVRSTPDKRKVKVDDSKNIKNLRSMDFSKWK